MLQVLHTETIARHKLGYRQSRSKLTKLSRLQSERSQHQPGVGTLDAMRIEYRSKEQEYQDAIDDIREGIVKPVIKQQDYQSQCYGCANPYNLHTRTGTQTEYLIVTIVIAGSTDAHPSEDEECQINAYRPPVK